MAETDLQITRECFELHQFKTAAQWQQRSDGATQLFVENSTPASPRELRELITPGDLDAIERAVVEIRPWHTDRLYASVFESNPVLTQFAAPEQLLHAREFFRDAPFVTILVVSELPSSPDQRAKALESIELSAVDHVIEFPSILRDLVDSVSLSVAYNSSSTLKLLQTLKRYRLLRHQQMEFQFPMEAPFLENVAPPQAPDPVESDDD